jgi:hypothetical protein
MASTREQGLLHPCFSSFFALFGGLGSTSHRLDEKKKKTNLLILNLARYQYCET